MVGFCISPNIANVLPTAYIDYLKTEVQKQRQLFIKLFGNQIIQHAPVDAIGSAVLNMIDRYIKMVALMKQSGVNLIFGTDTSSGGFGWGNPPGLNGYWELKDWYKSGISLQEIFKAVTLNNAKAFNLEDKLGTVENKKSANLLILNKNPLDSITAYDSIQYVILNGKLIERSTLKAQ